MSNLRSDSRDLVKKLPAGNVYRAYIERLCYQIDELEERGLLSNSVLFGDDAAMVPWVIVDSYEAISFD